MSVQVGFPNYFSAERYSDLSASSSNSAFPISNLEGSARRSRVWQSSGHFTVTSLNNTIIFRDAPAGADKTATIVVGEYASITAFMAAVDAALEAVGASNYTVTQGTDKKFVFSTDLTGGATSLELRGADVLFTAKSILGLNASNKSSTTSITSDFVSIHTNERITIDLGTAFNPKMFCMFGPRNEVLRIQSSAVIRLQANATNVWTAPEYDQVLTWNEFGIWKFGELGLHTQALRYWSINIVDTNNPRGYVEISSLFLGDTLTMTKGCPQFPLSIQEVDLTESERTLAGGSFSSIYGKTSQLTLNWEFLTKLEMDQFRDLFAEVGVANWFVVMLDPDEVLSADQERYMLQVKFDSAPSITLDRPGQWSSPWSLVENV